jgi:prepilin-type N-terminal cleavage/methylation domain-containing protein
MKQPIILNRRSESEGLVLSKRSASKGFTLIELLVVAVILTLLSVVIAQVFFTTMRTNSKTETVRDMKESGDRAIDIMTRLVQNAESIELPPESCKGGTIDTMILKNSDGGETTLACYPDDVNSIARIASTSSFQRVYLTGSNVTLFNKTDNTNTCAGTDSTLSFTCTPSADGTPSYITIGFTLRQKNSTASVFDTASGSFQTTVTLRNK